MLPFTSKRRISWFRFIYTVHPILVNYVIGEAQEPEMVVDLKNKEWLAEEFPNPTSDLYKCGRQGKVSYICDPANVLKPHQLDHIDSILQSFKGNTPCSCDECTNSTGGFQVSVALLNQMHSSQEHMNELEKLKLTERFSRELRENKWNFGECENDAVIVISPNYRKVWTSSGWRFSDRVSPWCVNYIYKEVRAELWEGNITYALADLVTKYMMVLNKEKKCEEGVRAGTVIFAIAAVLFGTVFVVSFSSFFRQRFHLCEKREQEV